MKPNQLIQRMGVPPELSKDVEAPMAYKDINKVMAAQADLVDVLAVLRPRIVKMA